MKPYQRPRIPKRKANNMEQQNQEATQMPKWRQWVKNHKTALTATTTALIAYLAGDGTVSTLWQAFWSMFGF